MLAVAADDDDEGKGEMACEREGIEGSDGEELDSFGVLAFCTEVEEESLGMPPLLTTRGRGAADAGDESERSEEEAEGPVE